MKKIFCLLLSAVLVMSLFTACSKSEDSNVGETETQQQNQDEKKEVVELQFFHTTWVEAQLDILEKAIAGFEAANPDIKIVETRSSWTDAPSQLMASIVSGTAPDLIMCNTSMLAQFRGMGALADMSSYVPQEMIDSFLPSALGMVQTTDGKIDGLPQEGCNWALFYRKDLFEEAGLDPNSPPATMDEFLEYCKKLTKDTDGDGTIDQYGYGWPVQAENASDYWVNFMQMYGAGISEQQEDGTWLSKLTDDAAVLGTQFMVDLVQKYGVTPAEVVNYDWEGVTNAFCSGQVAMMQNGAWVVNSVREKAPELADKFGVAVLFSGDVQKAYRGYPNTFNILEASQHKDEAWKFLDYLYHTPYSEINSEDTSGLTIAGAYCNASGGMLYTTDFVEYAKDAYEPLLQPFLDEVNDCKIPPLDPEWQTLTSMYSNLMVQQMIMGEVGVKDGLAELDSQLKLLHGE